MLFQLPTTTECMLTTFVGRTQKSGPDDVPAVTFRLQLSSVSNALLDLFSKTIRHTVYRAVEGQEQLPGMEDTTPILQSKDLTEWKPDTCLEGWTVMLSRGVNDDDTGLQMGSCKIDDFRFDFFDGGHMDVDFRVSTADVDEAGAGMLWGRQKRKVFVIIKAPEMPAAKPVIDGSKGHPGLEASKAAEADRQAGDLFAEQHGDGADEDGAGASDQHAGDFGTAADDDSAGPGTGSSDDWPLPDAGGDGPTDSEGGETDAAGDAAQFEAGAKAAIEKASGRRGRRTRASME